MKMNELDVKSNLDVNGSQNGSNAEASRDDDLALNRNILLDAVEGLSPPNLVKIFFPTKGNSNRTELLECIKKSQKANGKRFLRRLFSGLINILEKIITTEEYVPSSLARDDTIKSDQHSLTNIPSPEIRSLSVKVSPDENSSQALIFMKCCSLVITAYLQGVLENKCNRKSSVAPLKFLNESMKVSVLLHSTLFSLQSCGNQGRTTQRAICTMCEQWWQGNFEHREHLVPQLIPLLLSRSLDDKPSKEDLSRLYKIRFAMDLFDFEDDAISYLKSLCLRTISSPIYLRNPEGKNLIAFFFQLHESMVIDIHKAIMAQIPSAKKLFLASYGKIYAKAWHLSESNSSIRKVLEEYVFHDLVHSVIHLSSPATSKAIRQVLTPVHQQKCNPQIDKLLNRIYSPILWRSLSAANPFVRINAAEIFAITFPLHDPDEGTAQIDACFEKSVNVLHKLMIDRDPRVRVAGSGATTKVLARFWDAIPSEGVRSLLMCIITKHASDASSADVRVAAMSAITLLLNECIESQAVLRQLLPILGNLIHDKVEKVRLAVVRMLSAIKKIKGIRYYHVVSIDHLLARLSGEKTNPCGPVASALSNLLLNSYFPQGPNITGADQVQRTLAFLSSNPIAASVFYQNISTHLSLNSVSKLAVMLVKYLSSSIFNNKGEEDSSNEDRGRAKRIRKSKRLSNSESIQENNKSSKTTMDDALPNSSILAATAETITHLLDPICTSFRCKENVECQQFILDAFSETVLTNLHSYFENKQLTKTCKSNFSVQESDATTKNNCKLISTAVLRWAAITTNVGNKMNRLINHLTEEIDEYAKEEIFPQEEMDLSSHFALLCLWGKTIQVATTLSKPISEAFQFGEKQNSNRKSRKRNSETTLNTTIDSIDLSPHVAIQILVDIFRADDLSKTRQLFLSSEFSCQAIQNALWDCIQSTERLLGITCDVPHKLDVEDVSLILKAFELYGKIVLHKEALKNTEPLELNTDARTYFSWISTKVVPYLMQKTQMECSPFKDLNISGIDIDGSMEVVDASFEMTERLSVSFNKDVTDTTIFASAFAISIVKIGTFICSDFISIGGMGCEEISKFVLDWIIVLRRSHRNVGIHHLIPCFCKLTFQLASVNQSYGLLKELLASSYDMEPKSVGDVLIKKTIISMIKTIHSNHSSNSLVDESKGLHLELKHMMEEIFSSKSNFCLVNSAESVAELPSTLDELCFVSEDMFSVALSTFISFNQASRIASIDFIVDKLNKMDLVGEECTFLVLCLYVITNQLKNDHIALDKMKKVLLKIERNRFEKLSREHEIMNIIIDF